MLKSIGFEAVSDTDGLVHVQNPQRKRTRFLHEKTIPKGSCGQVLSVLEPKYSIPPPTNIIVAAKPHYDPEIVTWFSRLSINGSIVMRFVVLFRALNGAR